jgi:glycosyltransferase involved in cell wall biosynthesis
LLQGFASLPEAEVHVVSCLRQPVKSPPKLADNIFYHSLLVPKAGWMTTAYQGCIRATRKKIGEIKPDIAHGQGTELDCALNAVFSGLSNIITVHGNMRLIARVNQAKPFSFQWLAARLERFTLPRTDGVVCITNYTQNAVAELAKKTWVVPNAVDQAFFEVNAPLSRDSVPEILCVGHICIRKNQNAFIKALDPLARERKFQITFLGQSSPGQPYDDEFLALVKERPWCIYRGMADRSKLREYFNRANLLALPSLEDNCPMVVLEAMAAGVPVVAAKVGGVPDLITDRETGLFCDPLNEASMRMAVQKLLDDLPFAGSLADRAQAAARQRFHPKAIASRHLEIYREVLNAKN